jgi:hypothetical protein
MADSVRVAVIGTGAIGSFYGGKLAVGGRDVISLSEVGSIKLSVSVFASAGGRKIFILKRRNLPDLRGDRPL